MDHGETEDGQLMARSSFVEREFWLALAEEPAWHLNTARSLYLGGEARRASQELTKVAAILNFESRHCHSPREEGLLLASVQELREVARQLRYLDRPDEGTLSIEVMDRVAALALRTIAAHQVALARDALEAGDGRMAGRYITETASVIQTGFQRGGIELGSAITAKLERAREVATRLDVDGSGSREESLESLADLDLAVKELGQVLTHRRR